MEKESQQWFSTNLDGEGIRVDEPGHLSKDADVPVLEERRVVGGPGAHVHGVRRVGGPSRADHVGLVEHVLVSVTVKSIEARARGGVGGFNSVQENTLAQR